MQEFPTFFKRMGRVKNSEIKIDRKENANITQQTDRRIPIHLQDQVDSDIEKLLKDGHIEKVNKTQDDVLIQSTVLTVKRRSP